MKNSGKKVLWRIVSKEAAFKADAKISPEYVEHTDYSQTSYPRTYIAGQRLLVKKLPAFTM